MAKKIKPPRPPMCLCRTLADWLLGIMSPSLVLMVDSEETRRYWNAVYEMDIEKLIETLRQRGVAYVRAYGRYCSICDEVVTALSTLQAENEKLREKIEDTRLEGYAKGLGEMSEENEKLRAELEQVKQLYESEKENFIDFACSGVPNLSPYCLNRHPDCVDERGWCRTEKCRGFSRERSQKED